LIISSREINSSGIIPSPIDQNPKLTGCAIERAYVDKGYRGHGAANPHRVFVSGQKRGVFGIIKRELRRRSAIEAVIGHMKTDGHLGRCYLKGRQGDGANVILTAVGYNLRLILTWLSSSAALHPAGPMPSPHRHDRAQMDFLTDDETVSCSDTRARRNRHQDNLPVHKAPGVKRRVRRCFIFLHTHRISIRSSRRLVN
jgi:hypothetical protein